MPSRTTAGHRNTATNRSSATWRRLPSGIQIKSSAPYGMNCSGMEGGSTLPGTLGTNYFAPTAQGFLDLAALGFTDIRLPYLWERMEPVLGAGLDPTYSGQIDTIIANAGAAGIKICLDCHNFGRYAKYLDGGITEGFTENPLLNFIYPWADYYASGYIILRDYGQCYFGSANNGPYIVSFNMKFNSKDASNGGEGLLIQPMYIDANNYYQFNPDLADGTWTLKKQVAGVWTTLASGTQAWGTTSTYAIVIDVGQGTSGKINITVNGTNLYTANSVSTDSNLAKGKVGWLAQNVHVQISSLVLNVNGNTSGGGSNTIAIGNSGVAITDFANHWTAMSNHYKNNSNVLAYDLMNEWHDMPSALSSSNIANATSTLANQAAINAIRATGDTKFIFLEYDEYSGAQNFISQFGSNPSPWWTDSLNKTVLSCHYYLDSDHSGTYSGSFSTSYYTRIVSELLPILQWGKAHNVPIMIGECGWPTNVEGWHACGEAVIQYCFAYGAWFFYWGAAEWPSGNFSTTTSFNITVPDTNQDQYTNVLSKFRGTAI